MRITPTNRVLLCWLFGVVAGGCTAATFKSEGGERSDEDPGTQPGDATGFGQADAGTEGGSPIVGSRLCAVAEGACFPDNDGPMSPGSCEALPDGGTNEPAAPPSGEPDKDGGTAPPACRVIKQDQGAGERAPSCGVGNPDGRDGIACQTGAECAPGFDCVDGEKGPVCRRYCCSGSCEGQTSKNGGPTFCDVQKPVDANPLLAPFCMPIKTCELLVEGACGDKETCAIVNERGDTGCVAKGSAKASEACDEEHCAAGLTCLGSTNNRRCYELCRTDGTSCATGQTCKTGAVFQDTAFGVCKESVP